MVPKSDGTFHMCVDYRALNDCTADASWLIPNIAEMFRRIGSQKPKIFGIMDLTQGYHQAPLTLVTRAYTSFITFSGVYQFIRMPFGPKRAPSNFQKIMASIVLTGLMHMICEMYIDDCTVFGDTNIEIVSRLKLIFERFRKHILYIKASKSFTATLHLSMVVKLCQKKDYKYPVRKYSLYSTFRYPLWANSWRAFWAQRTISEILLQVIRSSLRHCTSFWLITTRLVE